MALPPISRLALSLLFATTALAQTPFKREVDGQVRFFRESAHQNHSLGDGSCRMTAQVLTAMGHCHRLYLLAADGPYVRNPIHFLITRRQADGSFADADDKDPVETTLWVMDALRTLAPETFAAEITAGERWLATRTKRTSAFATLQADEAALAKAQSSVARGPIMAGDRPDFTANVNALLTMVKGQHNKRTAARAPETVWTAAQQKGFDFLMKNQDGGKFFMMVPVSATKLMKVYNLGLTGMGIASLSTKPTKLRTPKEQETIAKGLAYLIENQTKDGLHKGAFGKESINYTTCAAVMALHRNPRKEFESALQAAQRFLLAIQSVEGKGYAMSDRDYGSIGYGGDERGDLSNTQFGIQALKETGLDKDHEAFAKAIVFLQRTQNLEGSYKGKTRDKSGKLLDVLSGNDGGSAYYPGNSPAGYIELPDGTKIPRSYGSMTYALLKTYTLCGVKKDDPRLRAAVSWVEKNFDLDTNPGADPRLGEKAKYQGLYYYYMVMAQALDIAGLEVLNVPGKAPKTTTPVHWRKALGKKLAALQREDGGWINAKNGRWWEQSDLVCTTYAMLALEHCR